MGGGGREGCLCLSAKQDTQLSTCVEATLGKMAQFPVWSVGDATCPVGSRTTYNGVPFSSRFAEALCPWDQEGLSSSLLPARLVYPPQQASDKPPARVSISKSPTFLSLSNVKCWCQQNSSAACQAWASLVPQDPHCRSREPTPAFYPLISACSLWNVCG